MGLVFGGRCERSGGLFSFMLKYLMGMVGGCVFGRIRGVGRSLYVILSPLIRFGS